MTVLARGLFHGCDNKVVFFFSGFYKGVKSCEKSKHSLIF